MSKSTKKTFAKKSVAGAIFNKDKSQILLIKRRDIPVWTLPGGGVECNENPEDAVVREVEEETGLSVEIYRKVGEYIPVNRLTYYTFLYECSVLSGELSKGRETKDVKFFNINALPNQTPPPYPFWIEDASATYPFPVLKKISSVTYPVLLKTSLSHPLLVIRFLLTKIGIHINT